MNILIACEESQTVCKAFRAKGHTAFSCDLQRCSGGHPEWRICGDVFSVNNGCCEFQTERGAYYTIDNHWDMVIFHPPCTDLACSGARHFEYKRANGSQEKAIIFFGDALSTNTPKLCVENPVNIISGNYIRYYFPELCERYCFTIKPTQVIQPYYFKEKTKKTTWLWLKGLPLLVPTGVVEPELVSYTCSNGKIVTFSKDLVSGFSHKDRAKSRSKTRQGVADAMAEQWG